LKAKINTAATKRPTATNTITLINS